MNRTKLEFQIHHADNVNVVMAKAVRCSWFSSHSPRKHVRSMLKFHSHYSTYISHSFACKYLITAANLIAQVHLLNSTCREEEPVCEPEKIESGLRSAEIIQPLINILRATGKHLLMILIREAQHSLGSKGKACRLLFTGILFTM